MFKEALDRKFLIPYFDNNSSDHGQAQSRLLVVPGDRERITPTGQGERLSLKLTR